VEPDDYRRFTNELRLRLEADPRVVSLVVLGSTADLGREPDRWSDHDFFVVTVPGQQDAFRTDLRWLPRSDEIAFSFRETAHGLKAVLREGHLLEFAVFDPEELSVARVGDYRVLFDRERVAERMARVAEATPRSPEASIPTDDWLAGQFLTSLLVGVGRHTRGERLAGRLLVKGAALRHLAVLLGQKAGASSRELLDSLDPLRRFEQAFPSIGKELDAILDLQAPAAARALLALAVRELPGILPAEAITAVRRALS
jgi:hypothetical protein